MRSPILLGLLLSVAGLAGAAPTDAPPTVAGPEALFDNGVAFCQRSRRTEIRCLDVPAMLSLGDAERARLLDRAAAVGFNAVSFEAPLFGPRGLCRRFGSVDPDAAAAFTRTLEACDLRRIYAFPVLFNQSCVDALASTATASTRTRFFNDTRALGWEYWALGQAAGLKVLGRPLAQSAAVGGWLLYRGPWPGGAPLAGGAAAADNEEYARLRNWSLWAVRAARKAGYRQELGMGLWIQGDLGPGPAPNPVFAAGSGTSGPPLAPLAEVSFAPEDLSRQASELDVLPPVPGADAEKVPGLADADGAGRVPGGLDWDAVEALVGKMPVSGQFGFLEVTLDAQDWYLVGGRLGQAADKAEVPVLWRQDWRTPPHDERLKRLSAPQGLAGLEGPWPDDDWPLDGTSIWPSDSEEESSAPFRIGSARLGVSKGKPVLEVLLTRPAVLTADFGGAIPLKHHFRSRKPSILHKVPLEGLPKGKAFLVRLRADSPRFGTCKLATRWMWAPK
jgi:hypothetical protein